MAKVKPTEAAIRAAAISNFSRKGFEGTGVRDIAREVGLTPAALYHYIGSKEDLLVRIMRDGTKRLTERAEAALAAAPSSPPERLAALIEVHVRVHCETQLEAQLSDYEIRSLSPDERRGMVELRNGYEDLWRTVLEEGIGTGDFNVVDPNVCRLALIQMCTGVTNWYSEDGPLSVDELAQVFTAIGLQTAGMDMRARVGKAVARGKAPARRAA